MIKSKLIAVILLLFPLIGFANGTYSPGRVTIGTMFDGGKSLFASYNVRYNPAAASTENVSLKFYRGANSVVSITAGDVNSQVFICYITPTNNLWEVAQEAMRAAGNGAVIQATTRYGSSNCESLVVTKASASQY